MRRNEAERRALTRRAAARKDFIVRYIYRDKDWADRRHAEDKPFCSCYLCRFSGTTHQDMKSLERCSYSLREARLEGVC